MSYWELTENFVKQHNYIPKNVSWDEYISGVILHYEGDLEDEYLTEEELPLSKWLNVWIGMNYRLEDFDY